ncbi:MAG: hypothetical protein EBR02_01865 [Alphaproteobacteria bacterium]|nr:hypothetical protein [Alphaproteobacteria bacterium]
MIKYILYTPIRNLGAASWLVLTLFCANFSFAQAPENTSTELDAPKALEILPTATATPENSPTATGTPAPPAANTETKDDIGDKAALPPNQLHKKATLNSKGELIISVSPAEDSATIRFPFIERTAFAVFVRGHFLWVVFNDPIAIDLSEFENTGPTVIGKPQRVVSGKTTLLRIPMEDSVSPYVLREDGSTGWTIQLMPKKRGLATALSIGVNTEPPSPANVSIAAEEMGDPVTAQDPKIGDEMVIVPLYVPGQGVLAKRDFVEFALPSTAQGIVVIKKADEVAVTQLRNGIRISMPDGASISPGLPELEEEKSINALLNNATFFPYEIWKSENPENPGPQMRRLFHRIVESPTPQQSNEARFRLTQIYLSQGLMPEALAQLDAIERTNPAFFRSAKLAALRGSAYFMMYRFPEAAKDFSVAELNNNKEADYWRSMLTDLMGGTGPGYDYLSLNQDYISKYPPIYRQRLAIVAADRSIAAKDYNTALKIFEALQKDGLVDSISPYVNFLLAKVSIETGQQKEALEMWDKLAEDNKHPFVQARAEFSRIVWGLDHLSLSKDEAITRLEKLRLAWHGDSLELSALVMLGDLYAEKKAYVDAMRIWHGGVQSFSGTAESVEMIRKIQEAFVVMFSDGAADSLPPLDSLALYYEYRKYTPPGLAGGEMIERLASRLVSVDLLDQAAYVLDQQMRSLTEKETRSRLGTKLATIYLLNHQPQKALSALEDSVYGDNQPILRQLRNRLSAQIMVETGKPDKALATLGQDTTEEAERIRLDIYWQQKDWPRVISSAETILKARKDITAPLTTEEGEYVVRLALAYMFENDEGQLHYLHDYFGPLMQNNPEKALFEFLTSENITPAPTNFDDVIKDLADTRSFIENYRARIQENGLSSIIN